MSPGHEGVGTVVGVGWDVKRVKEEIASGFPSCTPPVVLAPTAAPA